jgi:hypothetical protein
MAHEITCPSGLRGVIRGMKVKDEQLFTDRKLTKTGQVITRILESCWVQTDDPGPYDLQSGKMLWGSALSSDRTHALIQLRIASYGKDYEFRVMCSGCQHNFGWGVELDKLDVIPVSDAGRQAAKAHTSFPITLKDGRIAKCRLLTGDDEMFFAGLGPEHESKVLTNHLARRIVELDGKTAWFDIVSLVEDMESMIADALLDATDEIEGGVKTDFDVECPKCHNVQSVVLPFEAGFFSSRKRFAPTGRKTG